MSFSALGVLVGRYASETGVDSSKKRLKLICRSSLMALARSFPTNSFPFIEIFGIAARGSSASDFAL